MFNRRFKKLKERRLGKYHGVGGTYDDVISCAAGGVACHYKSKSFAGVRFGSMVIGGAVSLPVDGFFDVSLHFY